MRQKRLLLSYPVYPNFLDCVVKSDRRIGIIATIAIGRSFLNTTLFSKKGKSLSNFEQTAVQRNQALRAGAVEFLAKPFDDELLLESVRAALES